MKKPEQYLTKRATISSAKAAVERAAERAMMLVGYVIKAEGDWIVKESKDGTVQRIKKYKATSLPLALD